MILNTTQAIVNTIPQKAKKKYITSRVRLVLISLFTVVPSYGALPKITIERVNIITNFLLLLTSQLGLLD